MVAVVTTVVLDGRRGCFLLGVVFSRASQGLCCKDPSVSSMSDVLILAKFKHLWMGDYRGL